MKQLSGWGAFMWSNLFAKTVFISAMNTEVLLATESADEVTIRAPQLHICDAGPLLHCKQMSSDFSQDSGAIHVSIGSRWQGDTGIEYNRLGSVCGNESDSSTCTHTWEQCTWTWQFSTLTCTCTRPMSRPTHTQSGSENEYYLPLYVFCQR